MPRIKVKNNNFKEANALSALYSERKKGGGAGEP